MTWTDDPRLVSRKRLIERIEEAEEHEKMRAVQARDLRQILQAWALGDHDKMASIMLPAFLREFGEAPVLASAGKEAQ